MMTAPPQECAASTVGPSLEIQRTAGGGHVVGQGAERILYGGDVQARRLEPLDDIGPGRAVGVGAVDEDDVLHPAEPEAAAGRRGAGCAAEAGPVASPAAAAAAPAVTTPEKVWRLIMLVVPLVENVSRRHTARVTAASTHRPRAPLARVSTSSSRAASVRPSTRTGRDEQHPPLVAPAWPHAISPRVMRVSEGSRRGGGGSARRVSPTADGPDKAHGPRPRRSHALPLRALATPHQTPVRPARAAGRPYRP